MSFSLPKVLISPPEACEVWEDMKAERAHQFQPILTHGQIQDRLELTRLLSQVDAAILGIEKIDDEVLKHSRCLKVISRFGIGYDSIDQGALKSRGIRLTNTPAVMDFGVARQTLAFLLAIVFNLQEHLNPINRGRWLRIPNRSCDEVTLGIVGMGSIGSEVARLARALSFKVIGFSRSVFQIDDVEQVTSLSELIRQAHIITLHVPLTDQTKRMISTDVLSMMTGKSLINMARGPVVDEDAILKALESGSLHCYATDVFATEPAQAVSLHLKQHCRVIATPHVGAMDPTTNRRVLTRAIDNVIHCLNGNHEAVKAYVL